MATAGCRILVLDDHVDVGAGLAEVLELEGHEVALASDAKSAIEAYSKTPFDFGFFDIRMPGMNGVDAFFEVRKLRPDAVIVMMSGFADEHLINAALDGGAEGLLSKPFGPEELLRKLEELRGARSEQARGVSTSTSASA
jgi:CheY-like chemotaxis protein